MISIHQLDSQTFPNALSLLAAQDADLAALIERWGVPPLWQRAPGFSTLLRIILEQQVSLASARATFDRLQAATDRLTVDTFRALDDETLRTIGFSRQKVRYGRALAAAIIEGRLDLAALHTLPDEDVRRALTAIPGIGVWTAEIYLLTVLKRADAWPASDLGVIVAIQQIKGLRQKPTPVEAEALAEAWRPWRGAATFLLWYHYLRGELPADLGEE